MTPEEYQWHINLVKDRYHMLDVNYEQAEKLYKYELDKNTYSAKHYFSVWEEWDYEKSVFEEILNGEQFVNYINLLTKNISDYEQSLVKQDVEYTNQIEYHETLLHYYETQFLPSFLFSPYLRLGLLNDKPKIEYLRAEYKNFLNDTKKQILTSHFRHNRGFKPNELKLSLLRHKLSCVYPEYKFFEQQLDEPTKAVALYVKEKFVNLPAELEELMAKKFKELKDFSEVLFAKHYQNIDGWHVEIGKSSKEDEKKNAIMSLLLLDKNKYEE